MVGLEVMVCRLAKVLSSGVVFKGSNADGRVMLSCMVKGARISRRLDSPSKGVTRKRVAH